MTAKIFKSIFLTSLAVFVLSLAISFGISYNRFEKEIKDELKREAAFVSRGVELYGD